MVKRKKRTDDRINWKKATGKLLSLYLVCSLVFSGCSISKDEFGKKTEKPAKNTEEAAAQNAVGMSEEDAAYAAVDYLKTMDIQEKVGQLFVINLEQMDLSNGAYYEYQSLTPNMKSFLAEYPIGGVILFSKNIDNRKQTKKLIRKLQKKADSSLFVAVDEEGGTVARIGSNPKMKTTTFPTMEEIGKTKDEDYVYQMASTIGKEIGELGFNVDFAPVADVRTSDMNREIGTRSFGADEKKVTQFVKAYVKGLAEQNVCSTLKHFPGQGASEGDTHQGSVDLDSSITKLRKVDFMPFMGGIEAGADFVMVSHISVSKVTETSEPASLSELIMTTILRDELSFKGLIITDAFDMASITDNYTSAEAAVKAVKAGADIVLMPENFVEAYQGVIDAVASGDIEESRIDDSVLRILQLKFRKGILTLDDLSYAQEKDMPMISVEPEPTATPENTPFKPGKQKNDKKNKKKS